MAVEIALTASVDVRPVRTRGDRRDFFDLPWHLFRNDPNWIPPLRGNLKELLGWKWHPFYDHAQRELFVARRDGRPVGRIGAIVDQLHNERYGEQRGFFGFFESQDDPAISRALFNAAWEWVRGKGMDCLRGPVSPSLNHECGLLIEGFDTRPTFMMPYNPAYYPGLIEEFGFVKAMDLVAYEGHRNQLPWVHDKLDSIVEGAIERFQIKLRPLNRRKFQDDVEMFLELYNRGMEKNWGFVPLPPAEVRSIAASLKHLLVPEMAVTAEIDGVPVGVVIGLPDYNPAIKQIDGRLFPFGFLKLLALKKQPKRIRVLSIAVVPEYQTWGLGLVLMRALVPRAMEIGVQEAEFSWILESNRLARGSLEKAGAKLSKRYRIYDYPAAAS